MGRYKGILLAGIVCLALTGCKDTKAPKLLEPVGETTDTAKVTRGEMYNTAAYESAVTSEFKEIKMGRDGIVQDVKVQVGDEIAAGSPILTLDTETAGNQSLSVDQQIEKLREENIHLNEIQEYDIQIAECELKILKEENSNDINAIQAKTREVSEKRKQLEEMKIEQEKVIAQLQLTKSDSVSSDGELQSPLDGTVVYLNVGSRGSVVKAGTVVAVVAKKDSKILLGDYIEMDTVEHAHKIYARIGEKQYDVTNVPYDPMELNQRLFYKLPLYSTFYVEDSEEIKTGMYASIIVITDYQEDVLQIPENALLSDEEGYYVYKVKGKERIRQNVNIGNSTKTVVEITSGLQEGDEVYVKP